MRHIVIALLIAGAHTRGAFADQTRSALPSKTFEALVASHDETILAMQAQLGSLAALVSELTSKLVSCCASSSAGAGDSGGSFDPKDQPLRSPSSSRELVGVAHQTRLAAGSVSTPAVHAMTANFTDVYITGALFWQGREWSPNDPTLQPTPVPTLQPTTPYPTAVPTPLPSHPPSPEPTSPPLVVSWIGTSCWACSSACSTVTTVCSSSGITTINGPKSHGKWLVEVAPSRIDSSYGDHFGVGLLCVTGCQLLDGTAIADGGFYVHWYDGCGSTSCLWTNRAGPSGCPSYGSANPIANSNIIGVAFDGDSGAAGFYLNGVAQGDLSAHLCYEQISFVGTWALSVGDGTGGNLDGAFSIHSAPFFPLPVGFRYWSVPA